MVFRVIFYLSDSTSNFAGLTVASWLSVVTSPVPRLSFQPLLEQLDEFIGFNGLAHDLAVGVD